MSKTLLYGATRSDETNSAYAPVESLAAFQLKNRVFVVFADRDNSRAAGRKTSCSPIVRPSTSVTWWC